MQPRSETVLPLKIAQGLETAHELDAAMGKLVAQIKTMAQLPTATPAEKTVRDTAKLTEADMPEEAMRKIFNRLDTDSDGKLSQTELEQFVWQDQAQPARSSPEAEPAAAHG